MHDVLEVEDIETPAEGASELGDMALTAEQLQVLEVDALHARTGTLLRYLTGVGKALKRQDAMRDADLLAVQAFHAKQRAVIEQRKRALEKALEETARMLRPHFKGKTKTWKTPWGTISFRKAGGAAEVLNREQYEAFVVEKYPDLARDLRVVVVPPPLRADFEKWVQEVGAAVVEQKYKVPITETLPIVLANLAGEMPDGVEHVDEREDFSYKTVTALNTGVAEQVVEAATTATTE